MGQCCLVAEIATIVVAQREKRPVHAKKMLGEVVADDDPNLTSEQVLLSLGILPDRFAALFNVSLVEGEGNELDLEWGTSLECGHEVLVGVAGKGTAVVPGHGKRSRSHVVFNVASRWSIPAPVAAGSALAARRYHPAMPEVRIVRPADVPAASAALVRAFYDDPVLSYMFPDPRTRGRALRRFFNFQLRRTYVSRGVAYTTEECRSTALWMPPRSAPPSARDVLAQLPMLFILGRRAAAALRLVQLVEARHPRAPHYYLGGLGTDPPWQGKGLGSAVMAPVLDRCDVEGVPAYLESSRESNVPFYRRHGFEVTDEVSVPDGSVRLWLMWREPLGPPPSSSAGA